MKRRVTASAAALCSALACSACTFIGAQPPALNDLRIEGIVVEAATVPPPAGVLLPDEARLRVTVETRRDLADYEGRFGSTLFIESVPCHAGDARRTGLDGFWTPAGQRVNDASTGLRAPPQPPDAGGRRRYVIFFRVAAPERLGLARSDRQDIIQAHDLRTQSHDLCFRVGGGNMMLGHRSREYRIPYPRVAEALARAGLPHAAIPGATAPAP